MGRLRLCIEVGKVGNSQARRGSVLSGENVSFQEEDTSANHSRGPIEIRMIREPSEVKFASATVSDRFLITCIFDAMAIDNDPFEFEEGW